MSTIPSVLASGWSGPDRSTFGNASADQKKQLPDHCANLESHAMRPVVVEFS